MRRSSVAGSPSPASPGARDNVRRMSDSADCRPRGGSTLNQFQAFLESEVRVLSHAKLIYYPHIDELSPSQPDVLLATFHCLDD